MATTATNDNTKCDHEWSASLTTPGTEACVWCPATREAPVGPVAGVDVPLGVRVVADGVRARAA